MVLAMLLVAVVLAGAYEDGVALLQAGDVAAAEAALEQAVKDDPRHTAAWWELGWARWAQDDFAGAAAAWERVSKLDPNWPEVRAHLHAARSRVALAALPAPSAAAAEVPLKPEGKRLTFTAAGDTMMGSDLKKGAAGLAPGNGEALFASVAPVFQGSDVAFLNLEGTLADGLPSTKCGPDSTACYAFRTPTRYTKALVNAGIDVVSNANNHAMDLGDAGMDSTLAALDRHGIAHTSRYGDVAWLEREGLKIAVIGAHSGTCCLNVNRIAEVQAAIMEADKTADIVIFSYHGGAEGAAHQHVPGRVEVAWGERRGDVKALSRAAIDAGADLVLGHGPHVLRAMEVYKGRFIAYSLGNFCGYKQFGTGGGPGGTSAILEVELAANGVLTAAKVHPVALNGEGVPQLDPTAATIETIQSLSDADFPQTGVQIAPDGTITWRR